MKFRVTSPFGALEEIRHGKPHSGIDLSIPENSPIEAIKDGVVHIVDYGDLNAGKTIFLKTDDNVTLIYGHLNDFLVREGQRVTAGQKIGLVGDTGNSHGVHLHLGAKDPSGNIIDPTPYAEMIGKSKGLWERFIENGQINQFEHADFSIVDWVLSIPGETLGVVLFIGLLFWFKFTRIYAIAGLLLMFIIK